MNDKEQGKLAVAALFFVPLGAAAHALFGWWAVVGLWVFYLFSAIYMAYRYIHAPRPAAPTGETP